MSAIALTGSFTDLGSNFSLGLAAASSEKDKLKYYKILFLEN